MSSVPTYKPASLDPDALRQMAIEFSSNPIYLDNEEWENADNPFRRQLRPQVIPYLDFATPLTSEQILQYSALAANRLLATIYEVDMMFLPKGGMNDDHWSDFHRFYDPSNRTRGEALRPYLEQHVFGFLDDEVDVSGEWTKESLMAYLHNIDVGPSEPTLSEKAIRDSADPKRAARDWLIQFAPDFLAEASPMIRNVMGYYGSVQSEWFKVIVDEYGYGVHDTKHSSLFERTLASVGLSAELHRYWQYYLTSSLMVSNYFHYLGKNHELFFRYLGALYYTETELVDFCRRAASLLQDVFGDEVDVEYFSEHVHIDVHHSRMVLDQMILPIVEGVGDHVIPEIVRGCEEFKLLSAIADRDFATQVDWIDHGAKNVELHDPIWKRVESGEVTAPVAHIVEPYAELSNTHSHEGDELCHIVSGTMKFVNGFGAHQIIHGGQGTVIWKDRLHGAIIESEECVYQIHSIGDHRACLS